MSLTNSKKESELENLDKDAIEIGIGGYSSPEDGLLKYKARMERRKSIQEERLKKRDQEKGLIIVFTGNGKGKTTASLGMALRALGHGEKVAIVQFIKGGWEPGESKAFKVYGENLKWHAFGEGFTWETQDRDRDQQLVIAAWSKSIEYLQSRDYKLVILDEINIAMKLGYLSIEDVLEGLTKKASLTHAVLTGRGAPNEIINRSDLVTEMTLIRHPFKDQGVKAQPGIEF